MPQNSSIFQAIDPQLPDFVQWAGKNNTTIYDSAVLPSEEIQFREQWEIGVPSFDRFRNFEGYRLNGDFVGLYKTSKVEDLSTAYIDYDIGYGNDLLPIFFKTKNFEGDFSYHTTIPTSTIGEIYEEPYVILVIN